jgi:DNA gyrase subunit A
LVGILDVAENEDLIITCKSGITIRMNVADISEQGRATQGVKLIRLDEGDEIAAITKIDDQEEEKLVEDTNATELNNNESSETTNLEKNPSENEDPIEL